MRLCRVFILFIGSLFLLSACTVRFISNYNGGMVAQLQQIQQKINTILIMDLSVFGQKKLTRVSVTDTFVSIRVVMTDLISTAKAIPNNESTIEQLQVLQKSIQQLLALRKAGFSSKPEIKLLISTVNDDFTSVYELQNLKRSYLKTGVAE